MHEMHLKYLERKICTVITLLASSETDIFLPSCPYAYLLQKLDRLKFCKGGKYFLTRFSLWCSQQDEHVINKAFRDKPVERASLKNKSGRVSSCSSQRSSFLSSSVCQRHSCIYIYMHLEEWNVAVLTCLSRKYLMLCHCSESGQKKATMESYMYVLNKLLLGYKNSQKKNPTIFLDTLFVGL